MPLTSPLRTLALALALALAAGVAPTGSWAQEEAVTDEPTAATDDESAQEAAPAGRTEGAVEAAGTEEGEAAAAAPDAEPDVSVPPEEQADGDADPVEAGVPLAGGADLPVVGAPIPGGTDFQPASTLVAEDLQWLDGMITVIITVIVVFVTALLAWVAVRYNRKRNPVPATFTHNSPLEVAWTIVPIVILVFIGAFSLPVLFEEVGS